MALIVLAAGFLSLLFHRIVTAIPRRTTTFAYRTSYLRRAGSAARVRLQCDGEGRG
jgi:hypothetical protein